MFSPGVGTKDARRSSRGKTAPAVTKGPLEGERSDFLFFRLPGAVKKGFFFFNASLKVTDPPDPTFYPRWRRTWRGEVGWGEGGLVIHLRKYSHGETRAPLSNSVTVS